VYDHLEVVDRNHVTINCTVLQEVTCLQFHPKEAILASGSNDFTIKLFDYSKASAKKAFKTITDAAPVNCMSFHPSGDYLVAGTSAPVIRMYDTTTAQCFVSAIPHHQHSAAITSICWSNCGKHFVSGSNDGSIKIWDGVSNRCISTFLQAHDGSAISSVTFSRNGKYVLSSGKDSLVKLWELSTSRCLIAYTGAGSTGKQEHQAQAVFNQTEDYVMFPDEATTSLCVWDSRNASRKQLLSLGHNGPVRWMTHSPTHAAFLSCSDDFRARFWYRRH
jgi:cleavage stimulation factor subunit 1